ncbi:Sensor protein ChvG [Hyphomicrobiales bacterium]|nr:Sensor protein ChvG [Hyphomicrobiales bacterium]CAH1697652.1 Sensor protein ChvG [Hyphomicrobiales bacterium]CAI0347299.1 Sensor protein ChvG [Hyphomicrobiales bacterium]
MATVDNEARASAPAPGWRGALRRRLGLVWRRVGRAISARAASSLTRRILVLNLGGLVALLSGFLYLNQFREGLIEARVQSLLTQGEIIAGAIAASATIEIDAITIDADKLLQLQAGESAGIAEDPLDFSINPEKVAPLLRRLVTPTKTRARVYDKDGMLTIDSRSLYSRGDVLRLDLPRVGEPDEPPLLERTWNMLRNRLGKADVPTYDDFENANGKSYPEVARALNGVPASVVRVNTRGQTIVSVAVPVQRFRTVKGALLLSTQGGDIDAVIASERFAIFQVFAVAAGVMIVLSVLFAGTVAEPIRKLADAAQRVRRGVKSREQIPDFTSRHDEIGHLSGTLRDMTKALYSRIEAIESFAADVAHELKNPLTSLRSAVETLPRARTDESRARLLAVIQHDVRRLDRLISDISDASRLDAELARSDSAPVDIAQVLGAVVTIQNETRRDGQARIELVNDRRSQRMGSNAFQVLGHDSRLGQVMVNLIDNARSFSPPDKPVRVVLSRVANDVLVAVEDEGPGIEPHALERIFERFYTDRPNEGFGQNSGLGLSISRQIVEAHRGSIRAENRLGPVGPDGEATRLGARFIVCLPAAYPHAA